MSKIKGYTMEEVAEHRKDKLVSDYNFCKAKLAEIRRHEQEIESIRSAYNKMIVKYRMEKKKDMRFRLFGTAPSRNLTLIHMVGMQIRGCGLSNLSGARNRKECENMGKSRVSKMNGYRSMVSRQKNDVFKFKPKKKKKG